VWVISEDGESHRERIPYQKGKKKEGRQNTNFLQSNQITNPILSRPQISSRPQHLQQKRGKRKKCPNTEGNKNEKRRGKKGKERKGNH